VSETGLIDLHRHLDGSLRMTTLRELAESKGIALPKDSEILFYNGMGLTDALNRFGLTLSVLQDPDAVARVASEICEDAIETGVRDLEIRFAPQLHGGASMESIVDAVIDGVANRAGIILCGLYGESPELIDRLVSIGANRQAVCGIDLAGGPAPFHSFSMLDYAPVFRRAKKVGLGRTVHAGEGRPAAEIAMAVEHLHAQRIGHGTTLLNDPSVLELIIEKQIIIEACPTSNVHTGILESVDQHPISKWIDHGVLVTICTDNTLLSDVDGPEEYSRVRTIPGMTEEKLQLSILAGRKGLFS